MKSPVYCGDKRRLSLSDSDNAPVITPRSGSATKAVSKTETKLKTNSSPSKYQFKSSPKKSIVETFAKRDSKTDSTEKKTPINRSPVKKISNEGLVKSSDIRETPKLSPVKQMVANNINEKLMNLGFHKSNTTPNVCSPEKLIYNSNDNKRAVPVVNASSSVSAVRKQFEPNNEQKPETAKPETLSLKAKRDLFEKAIEEENEAKSKQYSGRKRNAPVISGESSVSKAVHEKVVETKSPSKSEPKISQQKSVEKSDENTINVSNNILIRQQLLEEKLFGSETTTANAYKKELESRQQELELLKRPFKANQTVEQKTDLLVVNEEPEEDIPTNESLVDDETAQQTVCDAFQEIEDYTSDHSDDDINYGINTRISDPKLMIDKNVDIEYESPSKKNRLYPQLMIEEEDELCSQVYTYETSGETTPPAKPPRVYDEPQPSTSTSTPLRTISFYRREQSANTTPSVATVVLKDRAKEKSNKSDLNERNRKIQKRIDHLKLEVEEQNRIAGQASQALNLCLETIEFKGSEQHVEAEKVLLVCGQKRIAFLNEIQKLKSKMNEKTLEKESTKGSLTLSNLRVPLKGEFLVARAKQTVPEVHHFICIVYNGANVFVTNVLNTEKDLKNGSLDFEFGVCLPELNSEFSVVVHIYDLITMKTQIKKTPKKHKSTMKSPSVRSPGGPNAVLSTSFQLNGIFNIKLSNYYKKSFKLENFSFNSPLEGIINMKTELTVEHNYYKEGFFDVRDASGFWNLRWVVLKGHRLGFWRFPEDVASKSALGSINLKECINPIVGVVRQTSMRPNSIALITVANAPKELFTKGGSIPRSRPIKHLMSAENKEESQEWAQHISRALNGIRIWNSDTVKPYRIEEFEKLLIALD